MFKKPNSKGFTGSAIKIASGVAGAKLSDGIVAAMPESTKDYKKIIVAVAGLVAAAATNPKTTSGQAVQSAFVGMAIKQGTDAVTEALVPEIDKIEPKEGEKLSPVDSFINGVVGHSLNSSAPRRMALNRPKTRRRALRSPGATWEPARRVETPVITGV